MSRLRTRTLNRRLSPLVPLLVAGALAGAAQGSVWIAKGAADPVLRVDAKGDAQVTWSGGSVLDAEATAAGS